MTDLQSSHAFVEEFDFQRCLNMLQEGYEKDEFDKALRNHLKVYVPAVFKSFVSWTGMTPHETRLADKLILNVFKAFMTSGMSSDLFDTLKKAETPSVLCAKVFKLGEPTYSCRDCGVDPTCVLCIDCFQNSSHKHHKYRMSTSGGGGYCDCGDKEAWKSEPFCDTHRFSENSSKDTENDPLSAETRGKLRALFNSLNSYIFEMFTLEDLTIPPTNLLPSNPHFLSGTDKYITMLYNDEVHTYDQVTEALKDAIKCTKQQAVEYATIVDREGRAIVKIGDQSVCQIVKIHIEKAITNRSINFHPHTERKPLKVAVMCPVVFAHQTFASHVVQWLKSLIDDYGIIRTLYAELSLQEVVNTKKKKEKKKQAAEEKKKSEGDEEKKMIEEGEIEEEEEEEIVPSVVEKTILAETKMWKSARNQLRKLFMTGIFMNPTLKKKFAVLFTELFPQMFESFLEDKSVRFKTSFLSLALQLFSTAKHLIREHNLLKVLTYTFYRECLFMVKDGVFKPDIQDPYSRFKRSLCILQDIKYALILPPEAGEWNRELSGNFLEAFEIFLQILETMEGMDSILRQVESHVEFEMEWEHAFNFQFRFMELYSLMAAWFKSDEYTLEKSIMMCIKTFMNKKPTHNPSEYDTVKVGEHRLEGVKKVDFTVNKISIHQPLARMLINLFVCYNFMQQQKIQQQQLQQQPDEFEPHGLDVLNINQQQLHDLVKQKFESLGLDDLHIHDLWRPSLLVAVFEAQVNANMWRRNGLMVQNQVYYYRNVRCRSSMFDMDCMFMQLAASMLPPDEYLMTLIHSFGLSNWSRFEYDTEITPDESMKQIISLAESMLNWILVVFCERYVEGVGEMGYKEIVKYEVVHNLCIQAMAFSELTNSVSDVIRQPDKERDLEDLIKEVAVFKKPSRALGTGLYELKEEHYRLFNPFYYHYSKTEKSKSEENVKSHLKKQGLSACIHPPAHDLPTFSGIFSTIPNLFQCDVFIHIVRLVLKRSTLKISKSWSESQLEKVLFMMTYALNEEESRGRRGQSYAFVSKCLEVPPSSTTSCPSVLQLLHTLLSLPSMQQCHIKDLISSVHSRLKSMSQGPAEMPSHLFASSVSSEDKNASSVQGKNTLEAQKWAEMGRLRRQKVMAEMVKKQVMFIKENQEFFESTSTEGKEKNLPEGPHTEEADDVVMTRLIALGLKRSVGVCNMSRHTCILCQEDQEILWSENALVYCSFMQKSSVLSTDRSKPLPAKNLSDLEPLFTEATLPMGVFTSTCGHVMHASCWKLFFETMRQRDLNRSRMRMHQMSYDSDKKEFLCPMCECICNCVLPLIPSLTTLNKDSEDKNVDLTLEEWLDGIFKTVENSVRQENYDDTDGDDSYFFVPCPLSTVTKKMAEGVATRFQAIFDYMIEDNSSEFSESIVDMLKRFAQDIFERTMDIASDLNDDRVLTTLWNTCSYSIMSTENVLRAENKALFGSLHSRQAECIGSLIRLAAISSGVFPNDVVKKRCIRILSELTSFGRMKSLYRVDMFHCLVSLCLSLPTLYLHSPATDNVEASESKAGTSPTTASSGGAGAGKKDMKILATPSGRMNESNVLKFILGHHMVQIMLALPVNPVADEEEKEEDGEGVIGDRGKGKRNMQKGKGKKEAVNNNGGKKKGNEEEENVKKGDVVAHDVMNVDEVATEKMETAVSDDIMEVDEVCDADELLKFCNLFRKEAGLDGVVMTADRLLQHIRASALPFLRCSCLFFHYLTSVPAPLHLFDKNNDEFDIICEYLDLPANLSSIFVHSSNLTQAIISICQNLDFDSAEMPLLQSNQQAGPSHQIPSTTHPRPSATLRSIPLKRTALSPLDDHMVASTSDSSVDPASSPLLPFCPSPSPSSPLSLFFPRKPKKLLALPIHYNQLINQFSMFTCPKFNSSDESRCPAMCLVCGTIVCSQSYCCQVMLPSKTGRPGNVVGAAMAHSYSCGAGTGIFIRVRGCQVIMLHGMSRGCFVSPPYLDEHGETDEGLRRGNPLFLCNERYAQLQKLWLNHMIPEEIVHKLELMSNYSATYEWQHF